MTKDLIDLHVLFNDIDMLEKFIKNSKSIASLCVFFKRVKKEEKCYKNLEKLTEFLNTFDNVDTSLRLFYIFHNLSAPVVCETCGKLIPINQLRKLVRSNFSNSAFCGKYCFSNRIRTEEELKTISEAGKRRWKNTSIEEKARIYAKQRETNIERFGEVCTLKNPEVHKKTLETLKNHYGENIIKPTQAEEVKQKIKQTCIKKYGGPAPLCDKNIQEKSKKTFQKHFNTTVENPAQLKEVQEKMKKTCLERYGVPVYSQSKEWKEHYLSDVKKDSKRYFSRYKKYILGEREILVQGYEDIALNDFIIKKFKLEEIENSISFMRTLNITYEFKGSIRTYIPDFYIKNENLIIEVKSPYTYFYVEDAPEMNFKKFTAAVNNGYKILILIIDHKRNIQVKTYEDTKIDFKEVSERILQGL